MKFDRKFRGEILKIERRDLPILSPKFAVKHRLVLNPLIISVLQNGLFLAYFVKIFYRLCPMSLSMEKMGKQDKNA
jgi:hypothetical protein